MTRPTLSAVLQLRCAGRACAVDTTEDFSVRFDAVADDTAIAVRANRRQRVDCALEAIERVTLSAHDDFKRLVIIVLADFAFRHTQFVRARGGSRRCLIYVANENSGRCHWPPSLPMQRLQLRAEILLVLKEAESYHWSPSLRVEAVVHANTRCHRGRCAHYR